MNPSDYTLVPSEKVSEESADERDSFLCHRESKQTKVLWITIAVLALALILSIAASIWIYSLACSQSCLDPQAMRNAQLGLLDAQSFFPPIPPVYTAFHDSEGTGFQDSGEIGDKLWHETVPLGSGYFALPNPRLYDIPASQPLPNRTDHAEQYGTALTHNFHCLRALRRALINTGKSTSGSPLLPVTIGHLLHCVDYLRQSIECSSDLTLEWFELQDDGKGHTWWAIPGDGAMHQCRDYKFVKQFLESIRLHD